MYKALSSGAIRIQANFGETVAFAQQYGFAGVELNLRELAGLGADTAKATIAAAGLKVAGASLPTNYKESEEQFQSGLAELPAFAKLAQQVGCDRIYTYIWPCSDTMTFQENFKQHVDRLRPIAGVLADHGCRLAMEFLGPRSIRKTAKYDFIYNMDAMLTLAAAIGPNVGLLLDVWHWQMAGHVVRDLLRLADSDIVYVHINDAPVGLGPDEVNDIVRFLPGETGVLDITGFMGALETICYSGPVVIEPFSERLKSLSAEAAVKETAASLDKIWHW